MLVKNITLERDGHVAIRGDIIRKYSGRADLQLRVDGAVKDTTLTYSPSEQWVEAHVNWSGDLDAGDHTIDLFPTRAGQNTWGCGGGWGAIDTVITE